MWHGDWSKLNEKFSSVIECGKHQHNTVNDMKTSLWTFLTGVDKWYLRIRGLDPFLFGEVYTSSLLTNWAKEGSLLPSQGIIQDGKADKHAKHAVILVDTIIYHTTFMLHTLTVASATCDILRDKFLQYRIICGELNRCYSLDDAIKCVSRDDMYSIVKKMLSENLLDKRMGSAAFLISYKLFDIMLETAEANTMIKEFQDEWNKEAKNWKEMGNAEYKDGQYNRAVASYTMAIKTNRYSAILYGNRAQAYLKLGKLDEAELDGRRAIVLKPNWSKGYYRLAQAIEGQCRFHEAHCIASYGIKNCEEAPISKDMLKIVEEKIGKKCRNEGQCSKKYKKLTLDHSKSTDGLHINDSSMKQIETKNEEHWPTDIPELTDSDSNSEEPSTDITCDIKEEFGSTNIDRLKQLLKEGSENLIAGRNQCAIDNYEEVLGEIDLSSEIYKKLELESLCFKYALGIAYVASGTSEDIQKAIAMFNNVSKDVNVKKFPAIYYGLGKAYFKLNKFKDAEISLKQCLSVISDEMIALTYNWPGTSIEIEETEKNKLCQMINELIEKCNNPPDPDAICRYPECTLDRKIYYSDPHFKGFCLVRCHDQCSVEYHSSCWKLLKEGLGRTDKEFLGQPCITPDCGSAIVHVKILEKDGTVLKQFDDSVNYKGKTNQKHRKNKLEKKFEQKERRKKRKQESQISKPEVNQNVNPENSEHEEQSSIEDNSINKQEIENPPTYQSCEPVKSKDNIQPLYTKNSVPICVLKKEQEELSKDTKIKKTKDRKKQKGKNIMSVEEFCEGTERFSSYNEYQLRLKRLEESKRLMEADVNPDWIEFCERKARLEQLDSMSCLQNSADDDLKYIHPNNEINDDDEIRNIKENVYSFIEEFLKFKGPIHKSDPTLLNEIAVFPCKTQQLIAEEGGLEKFLLSSINFAIVNDYICLIEDVLTVYSLPKYKKFSNTLDSLDTFEDFNDINESEGNMPNLSNSSSILNPCANEYNPINAFFDIENEENETNILPLNYRDDNLLSLSNDKVDNVQQPNLMFSLENENISATKPKCFFHSNEDFVSSNPDENSEEEKIDPITGKSFSIPEKNIYSVNSSDIEKETLHLIPFDNMSSENLVELSISLLNHLSNCEISKDDITDKINQSLNSYKLIFDDKKEKLITITEKEYLEYNVKISSLEKEKEQIEDNYSSTLDNLTQLRNKYTCNMSMIQKSLDDANAENTNLQKKINDMQCKIDNNKKQWQQERSKLQDENKKLQVDFENLTLEKKELKKQFDQLQQENEKVKNDLKEERESKKHLQETIDSFYKHSMELRSSEQIGGIRKSPSSQRMPNYHYFCPPNLPIPAQNFHLSRPSVPHPLRPSRRIDGYPLYPPTFNQIQNRMPNSFAPPPPGLEIFPPGLNDYPKSLVNDPIDKSPPFFTSTNPVSTAAKSASITDPFSISKEPLFTSISSLTSPEDNKTKSKTDDRQNFSFFSNAESSGSKISSISMVNMSLKSNYGDSKTIAPPKLQLKSITDNSQGNSFEKLMNKLHMQFPNMNRTQLANYLKEYRAQRNNSLNGMTIDAIIAGISALIIKEQKNSACRSTYPAAFLNNNDSQDVWTKPAAKMTPWSTLSKDSSDNSCSICLEDMTPFVSFKIECGHSFHYSCIHEWVTKQSTCPICRVHILLPEEFPALGQH
ncbi:E3 ubiquitin-protein ligase TTC3-like [Centruroides sculpturatus]|uniref:E3 ubiquitin-protein ligase TTC3-like n=1 Tax=Centruroides sculpturatus TaxID=218467 RepID=UPI000C6DFFC9|nr:E3 ubiquitin-protein ligase TTC3-like [Centruroides sculpturatus]